MRKISESIGMGLLFEGIMSVEDTRNAVKIGASSIMILIMVEDNWMGQDLRLIS